jgi:hypothetical protein
MTSHRAPAKHSEKMRVEQRHEGEILGIQPHQRDSRRRKTTILAAGGLILLTAIASTAYVFWPKSKPEVFDKHADLDGQKIDCSFVLANYEGEDFTDTMIAGGGAAIYRGTDAREGEQYYRDHVDAVAVSECDEYYREHPDAPHHSEFLVHADTVPAAGQSGPFEIVVELSPTGRILQQD